MTTTPIDGLTPREREILTMIAEGDSLAEIAQKLNRSLKTIESHRLSLGRKLKVGNRVELAKIAIGAGLVTIPSHGSPGASIASGGSRPMAETELAWLEQINSAVEMAVGGEYLRQFCLAMSLLPNVRVTAICTPDPVAEGEPNEYLRCVIAGAENGIALDPTRYDAHGTPCQQIIENGVVQFNQGVLKAYPKDEVLKHFSAESYLGVQLLNDEGKAVGGVGIIGKHPINDLSPYRHVLEFFAQRLAAELIQHKRIEQLRNDQKRMRDELRQREEQLHSVLTQGQSKPSAITSIASRVEHLVGERFLRTLTDAICEECDVDIASVCTPTTVENEPGYYTLAISEKGKQTDPMWIKRSAAACKQFSEQNLIVSGENTPQKFPHCAIAVEGNYEAYIGARLELEGEDTFCGGIWILNREPIRTTTTIESVLTHYAPRVAAEVDQIAYIERLHAMKDTLENHVARQGTTIKKGVALFRDMNTSQSHIDLRISNSAGPSFFRNITNALCDELDVRYAGVCLNELVDGNPGLNVIVLSEYGKQIDTLRDLISGTPCEKTIEQGYFCCPADVSKHFPEDELLIKLNIEGYAGVCLETRQSDRIGILWVIDTKPLANPKTIEKILRHFAPRLSSELEQFNELEDLRQAREQLEQVIAKQGV